MTEFLDDDVTEPRANKGFGEVENKAIDTDKENTSRDSKEAEQKEERKQRHNNHETEAKH